MEFIIYLFTKQATLMRRSTLLSLTPQLVFPTLSIQLKLVLYFAQKSLEDISPIDFNVPHTVNSAYGWQILEGATVKQKGTSLVVEYTQNLKLHQKLLYNCTFNRDKVIKLPNYRLSWDPRTEASKINCFALVIITSVW